MSKKPKKTPEEIEAERETRENEARMTKCDTQGLRFA